MKPKRYRLTKVGRSNPDTMYENVTEFTGKGTRLSTGCLRSKEPHILKDKEGAAIKR